MRLPFSLLVVTLLSTPVDPASASNAIKQSIVHVYTTANPYDYTQPWNLSGQETRTGSGVIIAGQRILTNAHIVSDQTFLQVRLAGQAGKFVAFVEAVSHTQDLAILSVSDQTFFADTKPLIIGSLPEPGTAVVTYGFPEGGTRVTITEGILSRIDHGTYAHSGIPNLLCQIDAPINLGSSGGPVIADNEIVGLAFQFQEEGENIAYMIPAPVIQQFLTDLKDGSYDGPPDLPFSCQGMENFALRSSYGMTETQSGVLILDVPDFVHDEAKLLPNDILTSIAGFPIANDGTIEFRSGHRVVLDHVLEQMQVGDNIALSLLRNGQSKEVNIPLQFAKTADSYLVPRYQYDDQPQYYIAGGLVFVPLTMNYMEAKSEELPLGMYRYAYDGYEAKSETQSQVVILADVLSDEVNSEYEFYGNDVVREVNGRPITNMQELVAAFEDNQNGDFHRIVLGRPETTPSHIVLSVPMVRAKEQSILERYQVPAKASPDLMRSVALAGSED